MFFLRYRKSCLKYGFSEGLACSRVKARHFQYLAHQSYQLTFLLLSNLANIRRRGNDFLILFLEKFLAL